MAIPVLAGITRPTLVVNEGRARKNIEFMAARAARQGLHFRPHFKTHQSAVVGNWFGDYGVTAITVSSVEMAAYFAAHGWQDIAIAFPVNLRQIDLINALAQNIRLNLLVEDVTVADILERRLAARVNVWVAVDAGYGREGRDSLDGIGVGELTDFFRHSRQLEFQGLLAHFGDTYQVYGQAAVTGVYQRSVARLQALRNMLQGQGIQGCRLSIGDTPSCTLVEDLSEVNEIRPGNFVYYDLAQWQHGVCLETEIAAVLACPVTGVYPARQVLLVQGGAVHLSKDYVDQPDGRRLYGRVADLSGDGWGPVWDETELFSISQEHGLIHTGAERCRATAVGDLVAILPAHICLAVTATRRCLTLTGESFEACGP